jgi:hypothetical protein
MKIIITEKQLRFIKNCSINEASIDQLKDIFMDRGKITQELFDEIVKVSFGKGAYATWLIKRIEDGSINDEDVYKFKEYFIIFNKYKSRFPSSDINAYKGEDGVKVFIKTSIDIREKDIEHFGGDIDNKKNLVSQKGVNELKSVGINLLGIINGYQCFEVPQELMGNELAWKTYRKHLANCSGRDQGAKIDICTMASQQHFDTYLIDGPYYVFFNLSDPKSPYQFHYESNQFMDKNDNPEVSLNFFNFFKFLVNKKGEKIPFNVRLIYEPETLTPEELKFSGDIDLKDSPITSLPEGLEVNGYLNLWGSQITSLPKGLKVSNILNLKNTPITSLPEGLKIGMYLILDDSQINSLPKGLSVGNIGITLINTPMSKKYSKDEIRKMCPGIKGEIDM